MNADVVRPSRARGACPRLAVPMETGDGLLARLIPHGPMPIDALAALCAAARTHGNGLMEITARGSLQVRGLGPLSAPLFADAALALDAGFDDSIPVITNPLPQDPFGLFQVQTLASEVRASIAARELILAPKVSVIVDDGGPISLDALATDLRFRAISQGGQLRLLVSVGGDSLSATPLGLAERHAATTLAADLLAVLADRGRDTRARDVLANEGSVAFLTAAGDRLEPAPLRPLARTAETIGLHRLHDGLCAIGVALPFGQAQALDLIALLRIARANGADWAALAPQRTLLLGAISEMTAFALGTAADTLGFIVDARDPRRRVVACAGEGACASGYIRARDLAAQIAERLPQGTLAVHVSGCAKGCAHPRPAPLTIVGTPQGGGFIANGTARDEPDSYRHPDSLVGEAMAIVAMENADA